MNEPEISQELLVLVDKYIEGELSAEETVQLNLVLQKNQVLREYILANLEADFFLSEKYGTVKLLDVGLSMENIPPEKPKAVPVVHTSIEELIAWERHIAPIAAKPDETESQVDRMHDDRLTKALEKKSWKPFVITLVALVTLIGWSEYFHWSNQQLNQNKSEVAQQEYKTPVAVLSETINTVWEQKVYKRGQSISSCNLRLKSGKAYLKFRSGAELILEGPIFLTITDAMNVFCESGKLSAHIPQTAVGFQVTTPFGNVVDRGTDFALSVNEVETRVDVVKGRVDLVPDQSPTHSLTAGIAGKIDQLATYKAAEYNQNNYMSGKKFSEDLDQYVSTLLERREENNLQWDCDPNLVLRFDLTQKKSGQVVNLALAGAKRCKGGYVYGCEEANGPLAGTLALRFSDKSDAIYFDHDISCHSMSLITTVRIDRQLNLGSTFFSSVEDRIRPGAVLWQISRLGFLQFQIMPNDSTEPSCYNSKQFYLPDQKGTWCVFAVVADHVRQVIRFYVDGRLISSTPWKKPIPLVVNKGVLGNALSTKTVSERFLNGAMCDFRIYDRALTREEITRIGAPVE